MSFELTHYALLFIIIYTGHYSKWFTYLLTYLHLLDVIDTLVNCPSDHNNKKYTIKQHVFLVVGYFALLYFLGLNMTETLVVSSPGKLRLDGATSDVDPAATYAVYFRNKIGNKVCFCVYRRVL